MGEIENRDTRITAVIIDTSAFHDANSDFIGINSELLPAFFETIKEKTILLLTHPVLDGEIKKHLLDSSLVKNQQQLETYLLKSENILKLAGAYDDDLINKIKAYDVREELYKRYLDIYRDAVRLNYPNLESVFDKYFKALPPFAETGKKKAEFPDAIIIESVREYMEDHLNDVLLVVSRDGDWSGSFKDNENVRVVERITDAIALVNEVDCVLSDEMMDEIYNSAIAGITKDLEGYLDCECYDVPAYEFETDFEASTIVISDVSCLYIPLKVNRSQMLIQTEVTINVSGTGIIYDEDRSVWDSEDKCYWVREIAELNVEKGTATLKVESLIEFDFDNPSDINVVKTKIINIGNVDLSLEEYDIDPIYSEEDIGEIYDALEGHI